MKDHRSMSNLAKKPNMNTKYASRSETNQINMRGATASSPTINFFNSKHKHRNDQRSKRPTSFVNIRCGDLRKRRNTVGDPTSNPPAARAGDFKLCRHRLPRAVMSSQTLRRPSIGARSRINEERDQAKTRLARMCAAVRDLIVCAGEDPNREGLLATPLRYAKALLFFTKGYQVNLNDIVNNAIFREEHGKMVIVKDVEFHSLCEHHLVPFFGKMQIGYIPSDAVIGLSKLLRIAEMFSRRLQIQERLTREVAQAIMDLLKPEGVAVIAEACHLRMAMRGVEKTGTTTITSCFLGCFKSKSEMRNEFLSLSGVNRTRLQQKEASE